jgi:hypothetical protein
LYFVQSDGCNRFTSPTMTKVVGVFCAFFVPLQQGILQLLLCLLNYRSSLGPGGCRDTRIGPGISFRIFSSICGRYWVQNYVKISWDSMNDADPEYPYFVHVALFKTHQHRWWRNWHCMQAKDLAYNSTWYSWVFGKKKCWACPRLWPFSLVFGQESVESGSLH